MHFVFIKSIAEGLAYRQEMNQRLRDYGRDPAHFKIIAGVLPVVVNSDAEKEERQRLNERLMSDQMAIDLLSSYLRMDLSAHSPDQPLPPLPDEATFDGIRTALQLIRHYDPSLTVLQLGRLLLQSSDSWLLIGSAEEVADALTATWRAGAADGFNLMFPLLPGISIALSTRWCRSCSVTARCAPATRRARCGRNSGCRRRKTALPHRVRASLRRRRPGLLHPPTVESRPLSPPRRATPAAAHRAGASQR